MKIISLAPSTTEILFAIGAGDMVVADTHFCDFPSDAKKLPKVGSFSQINIEKIEELSPDLIFTSTVVQDRIHKELLQKGFKVAHLDPRSLGDIVLSIEAIGRLVQKETEAHIIVAKMINDIKSVKSTAPKNKPRVYIEEWYEPPMYSGNWVPDIVELAGGEYAFSLKGDISRETPEEKILAFDPEFIFVSYCGFGTKSDPQKVLSRKGWENISAVRSGHVYTLDESILNRPGPRIIESAKEIQEKIKG